MQARFCYKSRFENSVLINCLNYYIRVVFLYVGLLQCALGLSRTKGESPKDSYNATPRENPAFKGSNSVETLCLTLYFLFHLHHFDKIP